MISVDTLSLSEAKSTLRSLRSYQDISKKVGRRGKIIFKKKSEGISTYIVEYYPSVDEDFIYEKALPVFKKFFDSTPKKEEILFVKKEGIQGGMKVYKDDNLLDMSYSRIVNKIKM